MSSSDKSENEVATTTKDAKAPAGVAGTRDEAGQDSKKKPNYVIRAWNFSGLDTRTIMLMLKLVSPTPRNALDADFVWRGAMPPTIAIAA